MASKQPPMRKSKDTFIAWAFLLPNLLGFATFVAFPVIFSLIMSFTNWDLRETVPLRFIGFQNYANLFSDLRFWRFFYNTAFLMMAIPVGIAGSLCLALILSKKITGLVAYRTLFYLPTVTAGVALFILWKKLYNPEFGVINSALDWLFLHLDWNVEPPKWLLSTRWAKPAIMFMGVWTAIGGGNMLLYLAGLSNISQDLYDAANIDGANAWQKFWHVTWPQLAPTTFFIVVISTIGGLQGGFEQARVMTNGGPAESTVTLSFYIYLKTFFEFQVGYASSVAWVMFVMIFALTLVNWRFGSRYVNY